MSSESGAKQIKTILLLIFFHGTTIFAMDAEDIYHLGCHLADGFYRTGIDRRELVHRIKKLKTLTRQTEKEEKRLYPRSGIL
ncbi:MAG: hypothetical protein OXB84_03690, partial [Halobacteriovoraceae bacterium]|nr:hypothetical protein [Halobacteriovoraceae bacterium]